MNGRKICARCKRPRPNDHYALNPLGLRSHICATCENEPAKSPRLPNVGTCLRHSKRGCNICLGENR